MPDLNPAALLLAWILLLAAVVAAPWPLISGVAVASLLIALILAKEPMVGLLRRTRWLLLTVLILFGWMTPGMPVPGIPGATTDGLRQGAEQLSRLLVSLAMVAVLLRHMPTERLLAACHGLLRPLLFLRVDVDRFILRLALTLKQIGRTEPGVASPIVLQTAVWRPRDVLFVLAVALLLGVLS